MNAEERKLAQAAASLTVEDFEYLQEHRMIPTADTTNPSDTRAAATHAAPTQPQAASQEASPHKKRKRRHLERHWPETGAILQADYEGTHYEVEVIPAPQYKSGKALRILTGNAAGLVSHSMSGAMFVATESQRKQQGLGRKGLANGWSFWKVREGGANEGRT
jgi:hypothetical protein